MWNMDNKGSGGKAFQADSPGMRVFLRMMKISLIKKMTNDEVLRRTQTERQLLQQTLHLECSSLGHTLRRKGIEYQMITGKVAGKRKRGRQTWTFLGWISKFLNRRGISTIWSAENRTLIMLWQPMTESDSTPYNNSKVKDNFLIFVGYCLCSKFTANKCSCTGPNQEGER